MNFNDRQKMISALKVPIINPNKPGYGGTSITGSITGYARPPVSEANKPDQKPVKDNIISKFNNFIKRNISRICVSLYDQDISILNYLKTSLRCNKSEVIRRALTCFYYNRTKDL